MEADLEPLCSPDGGGGRQRFAVAIFDQRVAPCQRALRVVGGEREPEAFELGPPSAAVSAQRPLCAAAEYQQVHARQLPTLVCGTPAAGPQLAHELVKPGAVASDVLGRCPRKL